MYIQISAYKCTNYINVQCIYKYKYINVQSI